jgi:hypothetical protein
MRTIVSRNTKVGNCRSLLTSLYSTLDSDSVLVVSRRQPKPQQRKNQSEGSAPASDEMKIWSFSRCANHREAGCFVAGVADETQLGKLIHDGHKFNGNL